MASFKQYTASGGASEAFSIPTFTSDEIKVRVDGVLKTAGTGTTAGSSHDYEIQSYTVNGGTIAWVSGKAPSSGTVYIYRDTKLLNNASSDVEGKATYSSGQVIYHGDLNNNQKQVLRALEEQDDQLIQSWNLASGVVETDSIKDGTIVDADINASANISGSKLQASSGSNAGSMSAANFTKLGGIETGATADQSNAEIRAAVEAASDSNVFTDADHSKLNNIESNATADQTNEEIKTAVGAASDSNIFTDADHTKLDGIATNANNYSISSDLLDEDDFATDSANKVPSQQSVKAYISNTSQPKDAQLTTLAGMQAGTATNLASSTALTSTTTELNLLDGKSIVTTVSGSSTDVQLPTAKAVNDQIANLLNEVGGFVPIADDQSFPNANPDPGDNAGTIVSIADAGGLVVNSSGVSTTGRTLGGATVTINGIDTALRGTTIAAGKGMLVQTTTTLNTYDYHRLIVDEAGVASAQTLVSDFNDRYQVAGSAPSTHPDGSALADGDLWFDTASNTMKVYDLGNTSYSAVTSVGDYKLLTVVDDGQTSGNPTYNSSNVSFDLRDGSNAASITSVGQLLISVNGVLQKPNAGSWSASNEGFHLEGTNGIKFCTAPASGDSIFVTLIGSATSVNVPATNSIVEAAIQDNQVSEGKLKISNAGTNGYFLQKQSGDTGGLTWAAAGGAASIANDSIVEAKLDIHADPSGTNKFLGYTSNGMEWAVPPDTQLTEEQVEDFVGGMLTGNTETGITVTYEDSDGTIDFVVAPEGDTVKSTGESGGTKFLREDGDGTCSWQTVTGFLTTAQGGTSNGQIELTLPGAFPLKINNSDNAKIDLGGSTDPYIQFKESTTNKAEIAWSTDGYLKLNNSEDGSQIRLKDDFEFSNDGTTFYPVLTSNSSLNSAKLSGALPAISGANLTNLPAASGAIDLVADGAIATGKPVILQSNGKVKEVGLTITNKANVPSAKLLQQSGSYATRYQALAYSTTSDRCWASRTLWGGTYDGYGGGNVKGGFGALGNTSVPSGGGHAWDDTDSTHTGVAWDPDTNQFIMVWRDEGSSNVGKCCLGTLGGGSLDSMTFGAHTTFHNSTCDTMEVVYNTSDNKVVVIYRDTGDSDKIKSIVGTVSGTGISFGTAQWTGIYSNASESANICYDSNSNRLVVVARHVAGGAASGAAVVGNPSGTSISWGSLGSFSATAAMWPSVCFDSNSNKVVVIWRLGSSGVGQAAVGTVDASNNTISFGTASAFPVNMTINGNDVCFDPATNNFFAWFHNAGNNLAYLLKGSVSGTSIAWADSGGSGSYMYPDGNAMSSEPFDWSIIPVKAGKIAAQCSYNSNNYQQFFVFDTQEATTNVTDKNCIGFANTAISDGNTGTISLNGSLATGQSGLTPATRYWVQDDGTLANTIGTAQAQIHLLATASDKGLIQVKTDWTSN